MRNGGLGTNTNLWGSGLRRGNDGQGYDEGRGVSELVERTEAIMKIKQVFSLPRDWNLRTNSLDLESKRKLRIDSGGF